MARMFCRPAAAEADQGSVAVGRRCGAARVSCSASRAPQRLGCGNRSPRRPVVIGAAVEHAPVVPGGGAAGRVGVNICPSCAGITDLPRRGHLPGVSLALLLLLPLRSRCVLTFRFRAEGSLRCSAPRRPCLRLARCCGARFCSRHGHMVCRGAVPSLPATAELWVGKGFPAPMAGAPACPAAAVARLAANGGASQAVRSFR